MKKIAISVYSPAPYWNEVFRAIQSYCDIDVYYEHRSDAEKEWKTFDVIEGYYYSDVGILGLIRKLSHYDLVILGGWLNLRNIVVAFSLWILRRKFSFFSDYPEKKKRSFCNIALKRFLLTISDYLFAASEATKTYYIDNYQLSSDKVKILHYTYSAIGNTYLLNKYNAQRSVELQEVNSRLKLFIASRFIERKGYEIVYEAFCELSENNLMDKFDIVISGTGPLCEYYKEKFQLLSSNISILGWVELDRYLAEMNKCDIYLHPSLHEPFGIPPLDAMIRGKLLIVSDGVKSTVSIIENRENALLYHANSSNELFQCLCYALNNKTKIYSIAEKGKCSVLTYYSPSHIVEGIKEILKD